MRPQTFKPTIIFFAAALGSVTACSVHGAPIFQSSASVSQFTDSNGALGPSSDIDRDFQFSSGTAATSAISGVHTSDVDYLELQAEEWIPLSHSISYTGETSASNNGMSWSQSAVIDSLFRSEPVNDTFDPNNAVRENFSVSAFANHRDSLTVSGDTDLAFIQATLQFDGLVKTDSFIVDNFIQIRSGQTTIFNSSNERDVFNNPGEQQEVDRTLVTGLIPVLAGLSEIDFEVSSSINFAFGGEGGTDQYFLDEMNFSSIMDFSSTLVIDELSGFNSAGDQVDLESARGSDGFLYNTARVDSGPVSVPEPDTLALFGLGLVGLMASRRRQAA
jgi:hypothetical protein